MLRPGCAVVVVALAIQLRGALREARCGVRHGRHELHRLATRFAGARLGRLAQPLHPLLVGDRPHSLPTGFAQVEGAHGRHRLDPQFCLRVAQRIAAASADTQRADPPGIHLGMLQEVVDRAADVIETLPGHLHQAWLAAALALIGSVVGQRDEPLLRQSLGVESRGLFLHAAERVRDDDRSMLAARGEACWLEQVGDDGGSQVPGGIGDSFDRHALLVRIADHRRHLHARLGRRYCGRCQGATSRDGARQRDGGGTKEGASLLVDDVSGHVEQSTWVCSPTVADIRQMFARSSEGVGYQGSGRAEADGTG